MKKIIFDLDGTLYDLYSIPDWEKKLRQEKENIFLEGKTFLNDDFYEIIEELRNLGFTFDVATWLPMFATKQYEEKCKKEKEQWIRKNLKFINNIYIDSYGIPKQKMVKEKSSLMILIDDNIDVCKNWETKKQRKYKNVNNNLIQILEEILWEYME
jgi:FMN phosphatase YigB (HAD superfamily)